MSDCIRFVQFIHPGGEHAPDIGNLRSWNKTNQGHKRKFLRSSGTYLSSHVQRIGEIDFWGEWEPESVIAEAISSPLLHGPRNVFRPHWQLPDSFEGLQNTDPFVFGKRICYMGCQQRTRRWETRLRHLDRGSVVLFGSQVAGVFVVDTVFVVQSWIEHSAATYAEIARCVDSTYFDVTFRPWYAAVEGPFPTWRLYFGATIDDPVNDMYSFFPCLQATTPTRGFARPSVELEGFVNPALRQGKKAEEVTMAQAIALWTKVRDQVVDQGLLIGLGADMPAKVGGAT